MRNVWIFFQTWDSLQSLLQIQSILNVHWRYFSRLTSEAFVVNLNMYAYSLFSRMGSVDVPNLKKKSFYEAFELQTWLNLCYFYKYKTIKLQSGLVFSDF